MGSHAAADDRPIRAGCVALARLALSPARPSPPRARACRSLARRGRGAVTNPARASTTREAPSPFDDGWNTLESLRRPAAAADHADRDSSKTVISPGTPRPISASTARSTPIAAASTAAFIATPAPATPISATRPAWISKPSLVFKPDVAALLERELKKPGYVAKPLALGSNTDPYQPVDRTLKLTRAVMEVLERLMATRSASSPNPLACCAIWTCCSAWPPAKLVRVWLSVTTLDPQLARRMEPRAATPERRLAAIAALSQAGIPTGVLAAPMIPGLNDAELEKILERAAKAGAQTCRLRAAAPAP